MSQEKARIVKSHDIRIDNDYVDWISEVKHRYRSSQVKAAVKVNAEKLLFNWHLGRDLVQKKAEERWGAGVVEQVSLDLKREFPNTEGFSTSNLWYMKKWYLFYTDQVSLQKLQCFVGKLQSSVKQTTLKLQRPVGEIIKQTIYEPTIEDGVEFPQLFALVPWGQHIEIITRSESIEEALFYLNQVIDKGLSRPALINCIKANLYEHQGKIINNFTEHLPDLQSKLVQEVLKENYDFGFATVNHEIYNEAELEESLTKNVTDLLLEMGTGFAFLGRQKDDDNPTIGLLVCSDMDNIDVQWSFKGISTPMGVATYNNIRIKDALPSQEQLADRVRLLQKELQETKRLMKK